ncbi:MAG: ATP-binding cassette domain-containing protein [Pseudomonadota bacterium]
MKSNGKSNGRAILRRGLRQGRAIVPAAFTLSFLANVLRLSGPMFMILIYDRVLPSRSVETLVVLFAMVAVLLLALGMFDYARKRLLVRFAARFQETVENAIFSSTSKDKFFNPKHSKPVSGLDELDAIRTFINGSSVAIMDFIWSPLFLMVVFILHPTLGFVTLGGMAVLVLLTLMQRFVTRTRDEQAQASATRINKLKNLMVASRQVVRAQEMTSSFNRRWLEARRTSRDHAIEANDLSGGFKIALRQLRMVLQYAILGTGAYLTLQTELTIGGMVAAMFISMRAITPVEGFLTHLPNIVKTRAGWRRLEEILNASDRYSPPEQDDTLPIDLILRGVSCRSPLTGELVLRNVSFDASPGNIIEINGDSGVGKTALAEVILGMWSRSSGQITVAGQNVDRYNSEQASRIFGYMPEQVEFLEASIAENIAHLEEDLDRERVHEVARLALIHKSIMALPNGYDTQLGSMRTAFSRGQRNRIGFARALYYNPRILLLDDPDPLLRGALAHRLQPMLQEFCNAGGIVILLARKPLRMAGTSKVFDLKDGQLRARELTSDVTELTAKKAASNVATMRRTSG